MKKSSFDFGWTVKPGVDDPFGIVFNPVQAGKPVALPHDAMIAEARNPDSPSARQYGYYPAKSYTYLKTFHVPEDWAGQTNILEFEGVMQKAIVFCNNEFCASHANGYTGFFVDLAPFLRFGEDNTIKVVSVCEERASRWYPGAGIYRIPFSLSSEVTSFTRPVSPTPFVPQDQTLRAERCGEILTIAALGLKKRLEHTAASAAVIGLSGGLDSTLALLITARAMELLGRPMSDILCVTMPCFGTTKRTRSNAEVLAERVGAKLKVVDITAAVKQHFADVGQSMDDHSVTFENAQARERTQVLMDLANQRGGLVIGTGDLSELALGWATYNGDHMSMYGVNASIPKTLVRYLVKYEAERSAGALRQALEDVLATPVSPELLPPKDGEIAQKTEELVGPYELHDFFLYYMLRFGFTPGKIYRMACRAFAEEYSPETIKRWLSVFYRRFFIQQFKRSCLPDGPKVGSVTLSPRGDFRMPSDACRAAWEKEIESL